MNGQLLGFNLTKIHTERFLSFKDSSTEKKASTNIEFTNIEKEKLEIIGSDILKVSFKFEVSYEPKAGEVLFEGVILIKLEEDATKDVLKNWKDKKVKQDFKLPLLNLVLQKCTLRALQLEEEIGLPTHIGLPKLVPSPEEKD